MVRTGSDIRRVERGRALALTLFAGRCTKEKSAGTLFIYWRLLSRSQRGRRYYLDMESSLFAREPEERC
jgi:hypothetical protein